MKVYEELFNKKIDYFKEHERYKWLRGQADIALRSYTGYGWEAIICDDFMKRIVTMPLKRIADWLDAKNKLEWEDKNTGEIYDSKCGYNESIEKYIRDGSYE